MAAEIISVIFQLISIALTIAILYCLYNLYKKITRHFDDRHEQMRLEIEKMKK